MTPCLLVLVHMTYASVLLMLIQELYGSLLDMNLIIKQWYLDEFILLLLLLIFYFLVFLLNLIVQLQKGSDMAY